MENTIFNNQETSIELIEIDYKGLAKVLKAFAKLYEVSDNKPLIDKMMQGLLERPALVMTKET